MSPLRSATRELKRRWDCQIFPSEQGPWRRNSNIWLEGKTGGWCEMAEEAELPSEQRPMEKKLEQIAEGEYYKGGKSYMGVGGGAYTNTFTGRFVLSPDRKLKPCVWIRRHGPLACELNQGVVSVEIGDIVCFAGGSRPATPSNPDVVLACYRVEEIKEGKKWRGIWESIPILYGSRVEIDPEEVPESVWKGMNIYHNRSGDYFCG
jgi:hypothetical protein